MGIDDYIPSDPECWRPLGRALLDHLNGRPDVVVTAIDDIDVEDNLPAELFFRTESELPPLEEYALSLCRGRILDVGAGAGCHARILEERGASVTALEVSPEAVEVMRRVGVSDARFGDIFTFDDDPYDTLLLLMNGIGVVGTLDGLDRFLIRAESLLRLHGQILFDSTDLRAHGDRHQTAFEARARAGRYFGEVIFRLFYRDSVGEAYPWLFVDPDTLRTHALKAGWYAQVLHQSDDGDYLARLVLA